MRNKFLAAVFGIVMSRLGIARRARSARAVRAISVSLLAFAALILGPAAHAIVPNPILYLTGTEVYSTGGKTFVRYKYDVFNKADFPDTMFAPAPALPPCGLNTNSSRTWVDFFDSRGKRLYGFCALGSSANLGSIWFALEEGVLPPSWIYIEIKDRQTNTIYKSNLADTTL